MRHYFLRASLLWLIAAANGFGVVHAEETDDILRALHKVIVQKPVAVKKTILPNLFGVYFDQDQSPSQFVSRDVSMIGNSVLGYTWIKGQKMGKDLDAKERQSAFLDMLSAIPKERLITYRYGAGARKVLLFTAYDCPSCRALERELDKRANELNATVYVIPLGLTYFNRDPVAAQIIKNIWCADDRMKTWRAALLERKTPANRTCSENPDDFAYLGRAFPVPFSTSMPTAVTLDGRVFQAVLRDFKEIFG